MTAFRIPFPALMGLVGLCLWPPTPLSAGDLLGSDMTWQCLGNNHYKVTLNIYRDCTGTPLGNTPMVLGYHCASDTSLSGDSALSSTPLINGMDITPVCDDTCTPCSGGTNCLGYGVELYRYEFTADVTTLKNAGCCMVRFYWKACCRSSTIDNLYNPDTTDLYIYGEVDICDSPCNNSPTYSLLPLMAVCIGQDVSYTLGVVDGDNDSIVVVLARPLENGPTNGDLGTAFQTVPYISGYSMNKPLKFLGWPNANLPLPYGFHIDPSTGELQFRPVQLGAYVIVLEIREYRNGQLVGRMRRDMAVRLVACLSRTSVWPPALSGINGTNGFFIEACEDEQLCFNIYSHDMDTADSLTLSWNAAIPGATFVVTPPPVAQRQTIQGPTGQFCWTPPVGTARTSPYQFTAAVVEHGCPLPVVKRRNYFIRVKPKPRATYTVDTLGCARAAFSAELTSGEADSWRWDFPSLQPPLQVLQKNFTLQFETPGQWHYFYLNVIDDGCTAQYYDSVFIDTAAAVSLTPIDTLVCEGDTVRWNARLRFTSSAAHIGWSTGDSNVTSVTMVVDTPTLIKVTVSHSDGCTASDSSFVGVKEVPRVDVIDTIRTCAEDSATLTGHYALTEDSGRVIQWFQHNTLIDTGLSVRVYVQGPYILRVTAQGGCWMEDTVVLDKMPSLDPLLPDTIWACPENLVYLMPQSGETGNAHYVWYEMSSSHPVGEQRGLPVSLEVPKTFMLHVWERFDSIDCEAWDTIHVSLYPAPEIDFSARPQQGCQPLQVDFANLTTIAQGTVTRYEWQFSDGQRASLKNVRKTFDSTGSYDVTLIAESDRGCADTLTRGEYIEVYPVPEARFSAVPRVTTVVAPRVRFLNESKGTSAGKGRSLWYFDDPIAPNGGWDSSWNAEHVYRDTGHYDVMLWVWNEKNCVDSLVRPVVVGPGIVVYAPNVFTPDDQGPEANNVFRVVASGFSSFHIQMFDRWGKLIYESRDYAGHGWDGTINGKPAKEGVYTWMVRVTDEGGKGYGVSGMVTLMR